MTTIMPHAHRRQRRLRTGPGLALGLALLALALLLPATAMAGPRSDEIRERVEDLNVMMGELDTHEFADEAAQEFAQARLEVGDVQALLLTEDITQAEVVLRRLEARVALIASTLDRATIEDLANERESELFEMQSEADDLQLELEAASQQRAALQEQVSVIVEAMEDDS